MQITKNVHNAIYSMEKWSRVQYLMLVNFSEHVTLKTSVDWSNKEKFDNPIMSILTNQAGA